MTNSRNKGYYPTNTEREWQDLVKECQHLRTENARLKQDLEQLHKDAVTGADAANAFVDVCAEKKGKKMDISEWQVLREIQQAANRILKGTK